MSKCPYVGVNDQRTWLGLVDTTYSDTTADFALLRNGFVTLREGTQLFSPPGATVSDWLSISPTNSGDLGMVLNLKTASGSSFGVFWNTIPLALKNGVLNVPEVPSGTTWITMTAVKMNTSNALVMEGQVTIPGVSGKQDCLVRFQVDSLGNLVSTKLIACKTRFFPPLGQTVDTIPNSQHSISLNKNGDLMYIVSAATIAAVMINDTVLVKEFDPAPVPGRFWNVLNLGRVSINDFGENIYSGSIDGTDESTYLIVKNNQKFHQGLDILPQFSSSPLGRGSQAPIYLTNSGDVYWWAQSTAGNDDAFMRNDTPIVQVGKTFIGTDGVKSIEATEDAFNVSPSGRYWIGRVNLQVASDSVLFADFGLVEPIPGCADNPGILRLKDGLALPGKSLTLEMDNGQDVGMQPVIIFSTQERVVGSPCGLIGPFGEVLISPTHRIGKAFLPLWNGTPVSVTLPIPNDLSLVDGVFFAQGFFWDVGNQSPAEDFRLTNGLRIEIGSP